MDQSAVLAVVSNLGSLQCGVFRGRDAVARGVDRRQLARLCEAAVLARVLPDVYRLTVVQGSDEQRLRAALLWAGEPAAACGRSAGAWYGLEGVRGRIPEIVIPRVCRARCALIDTCRTDRFDALMIRSVRGIRVTGVEPTLVRLAHVLDDEALEVACEDARRRQLTSIPALRAYLDRHGRPGQRGVAPLRRLLAALDPAHPSRSTLEVKTRRLLVAHGLDDFARELPLAWNGRSYFFDFAFPARRTILETNGRRWHDDATDYEHDNEKWSVPGRHGLKLVLATWDKVTQQPDGLIRDLRAALAA
jgi:very-short-patch-repair endonuclease